jgi:hydroxymethylpyrimidine/phosphomethylpyrimidine kinase
MSDHVPPVALTIAGSDPSGGAGIQADLKTFHRFGVYGEAVISLITVQNTVGVERVECLPPDLVEQQIRAVIRDIPPQAAKTGALGNRAIVETVARLAEEFTFPLIVDPVMVSKHGAPLLEPEACALLRTRLLPCAYLLTPNLPEAAALTGINISDVRGMREAAEALAGMGAKNVLVKGGHLPAEAIDVLLFEEEWFEFPGPRIQTRHTHGTGCTYSAAITAGIALGHRLPSAVAIAKKFIQEAIRTAPGLGQGCGPVNHFADSL